MLGYAHPPAKSTCTLDLVGDQVQGRWTCCRTPAYVRIDLVGGCVPKHAIIQPARAGLRPQPRDAALTRRTADLEAWACNPLTCVWSQARGPENPLVWVCSQARRLVHITQGWETQRQVSAARDRGQAHDSNLTLDVCIKVLIFLIF